MILEEICVERGQAELPRFSLRHRDAEHWVIPHAPAEIQGLHKAQLENQEVSPALIFQVRKLRPREWASLPTSRNQVQTQS